MFDRRATSPRPDLDSISPFLQTPQAEAHTQTVESFFAILKRGVTGSFHSVSEQHLLRYVDEFAFRWNTRSAMGIEDAERASRAIKGAVGKRLTYRPIDETQNP